MDSFIRNVYRFLLVVSLVGLSTGFVLTLFINTANAATTKPLSAKHQASSFNGMIGDELVLGPLVTFETLAKTLQGQEVRRYTDRPVPINKSRLGSLARTAVGGPVAIAATAAFLAYDYIYDESTDTWQVEPAVEIGATPTGYCTYGGNGVAFQQCYTAVSNNLCSGPNAVYCPAEIRLGAVQGGRQRYDISYSKSFVPNSTHWLAPSGYQYPGDLPLIPTPAVPATDEDLGEAIINAPSQTITDILNDPISTGTWRDRWPEMEPVTQDISDTIGYDVEGTPTENYDPTISDGSTAIPKPATEPTSTATEWPGFCSWATVVCDFIDWFKEEPTPPESPDLPITEVNPVDWESGLGTGSCPANPVVEMDGTSLEYDLTNACWGASNLFQPILIFLSLIAAAYIIIGARD